MKASRGEIKIFQILQESGLEFAEALFQIQLVILAVH